MATILAACKIFRVTILPGRDLAAENLFLLIVNIRRRYAFMFVEDDPEGAN